VVQLCSLRIRKQEVTRLGQLIDDAHMESESRSDGHLDRYVGLSLAFHRELAACCGNSVLAGLTSHLVNSAEHPLWTLVESIVVRDPQTRTTQVEEHRAILRAVSENRTDVAVTLMTDHLGGLERQLFGSEPRVTRSRRRRSTQASRGTP
jgi:DNA-binding GntR family transcriptional regulator